MAEFLDRIEASTCRTPKKTDDKEASAVLALNDATAKSRKGRFYYLPESATPPVTKTDLREQAVMQSVVPRLLYANYEWKKAELGKDEAGKEIWKDEVEKYGLKSDAERYEHVQRKMNEELKETDVIPINLVIQTSGISSLSWPAKCLASVVIYGPGPWYRLSWMSDWTEKATLNMAEDTYTVPLYQTGHLGQRKARYSQSVNAIGHICGADDIPSILRAMLRLSVDECKVTEGVSSEDTAKWQLSENESRECTWIAGADISNLLKLEAENGGDQGALSTTERVETELKSE